jgi:hypothetical protein
MSSNDNNNHHTISIWYLECILPSSGTNVTAAELTKLVEEFAKDLGSSGGEMVSAFNPATGEKIETVIAHTGQIVNLVTSFATDVDKIVRKHGGDPDDLRVTISAQPGAPKEGVNVIYPTKGTYPMKAGDYLLFTGAKDKLPITAPLEESDGLVFWDKDVLKNTDDVLFVLPNQGVYRTDVSVQSNGRYTHVALSDIEQPIVAAKGLDIKDGLALPSGLYGQMYNDMVIFNARQDSVYRVIWTLVPTTAG